MHHTMLAFLFMYMFFGNSLPAQRAGQGVTGNGLTAELIDKADRERDVKVLRGLSKLRIGFVQTTNRPSETEARKLIFDVLSRYNVPADWTPTSSSYKND